MASITALIVAISTLLWPVILIALILVFRPAVASLIDSARSRKFTLKIGGQELSMDEANEQQRILIADLQSQIAEIRKRLGTQDSAQARAPVAGVEERGAEAFSVLWVDDDPKNNSYFVEELTRLGARVDLARSTAEGLSMFGRRRYSVVISDMGRTENGKDNFRAGLDLLAALKERDKTVSFILFSSTRGVKEHREEALRLGARGITSSASELYALLDLDRLK
jgi:CheY-like chemotaxis protein